MSKKYIALDPGGTTGVSKWTEKMGLEVRTKQIGPGLHHRVLWDHLCLENPDIVICEVFNYRPKLDKAELISVEYIGVTTLWCAMYGAELEMQQVLKDTSSFVTNKFLRATGTWTVGSPHANDATRHLLYYLTIAEGRDDWVRASKSG